MFWVLYNYFTLQYIILPDINRHATNFTGVRINQEK